MEFEHPYFLIFIPIFFLCFCYLWARGKIDLTYLASPNVTVGKRKKLNLIKLCLAKLPNIILLLSLCLGTFALARPLGEETRKIEKIKAYQILLLPDVSGSMGGGPRASDHTSIAKVVEFAKKFVMARGGGGDDESDVFGIVPFEGKVVESLVLPLIASTDTVIKYLDDLIYFDGGSTAIGEAEFYSLIMLLEKALFANSDSSDILDEISLDPDKIRRDIQEGSWDYGATLSQVVGEIENAIVIILTDSGNNTGINPIEVIKYAHHLFGVKFYAIRENVVGDDEFVEAIEETGGKAYFVKDVDVIESIFEEINRIERKEVMLGETLSQKPLYTEYLIIFLYFLCLYPISRLLIKIP